MKTKTQISNRILSFVLTFVMVLGMLPMSTLTAFATNAYTDFVGDFTIAPTDGATALALDTDYTYSDGVLTVTTATPVTIGMKDGVTTTAETIVVDSTNGETAVTFKSIGIDTEEEAAITAKGVNKITFAFTGDNALSVTSAGYGINVASKTPFVMTSTDNGNLSISDTKFAVYANGYTSGGSITITGNLNLDINNCAYHAIYCNGSGCGSLTVSGNPVINIDTAEYAIYAYGINISGGKISIKSDKGYPICDGSDTDITLSGSADLHIVEGKGGLRSAKGKITITDSAKYKVYSVESGNKIAVADKFPLISTGSTGEVEISQDAVVEIYSANDAISGGKTSILDNAQVDIVIDTDSTYSEYALSFEDTLTIANNATVDIDVVKGAKIHGLYGSSGTVNVSGNAVVTIDGTTYKGVYVKNLNLSEKASVTVNHKGTSSTYYAVDGEISIKDTAMFTATSGDYRVLGDPCTVTPAENKVYMVKYGASEATATTAYYTETGKITDKSTWRYFSAQTIDFVPITEVSVTVDEPAKNGTPDITAEIASNADYTVSAVAWNGNPSKFLGGTEYTATFTLTAKDGFAFTTDTTVTAGNATVTKTLNADGTLSVSAMFSATDAAVPTNITVLTEPNDVEYTYGEKFNPSGLVISVTKDDGTTEDISYNDGNKEEFGFSPVNLTVATTKITVTYAGQTTNITVKVNKAIPEYELPKNLKAVYGETLKVVELPEVDNGVWSWMNANTAVGDVGENTFKLKFTPNDTDNYYVLENIDVIVVVSSRTITITAEDKSVVVNTKLPVYSYNVDGLLDGDEIISEPEFTCVADISAIGEYAIDISDADAGKNYSIVYVGAKLTIIADHAVDAAAGYTEELKDYNPDTVTSEDKTELDEILEEINTLLDDENITDNGKKALAEVKEQVENLIKEITDAAKAPNTENTEKVKDVTAENVTPDNKTDLEGAKTDLEKALDEHGNNMTEDEKKAIEDEIKRIDDALEVIGNVEAVEELIDKLPNNITKNDEAAIKAADDAYNALSDYEKKLVNESVKKKLDDAKAKLNELKSPSTADNSNMFLMAALLFISGGLSVTLTVVDKKRKVIKK